MSSRPRVLIANVSSQIGLTMIRELGRHGVEVHGLSDDAHGIGRYSRYLASGALREEGEALVRQVRATATRLAPCVVMAISKPDICLLNDHRSELADVPLLIPDQARMAFALDKARTRELAQEIGMKVPRVWHVRSLAELLRADVTFPVVLKWAQPLAVFPRLRKAGLPLDKFTYCYNRAELEAYLRPFEAIGELPLIAEYCPGHGLGLSFFMWRGEALLSFQGCTSGRRKEGSRRCARASRSPCTVSFKSSRSLFCGSSAGKARQWLSTATIPPRVSLG